MNCREALEYSSAFIDGELSPGAVATFRDHVGSCRGCAEALKGLEDASRTVIGNLRTIEPGPQVWLRIQSRIASLPAPRERSGFWGLLFAPRLGLAAAASVLILALVSGTVTVVLHRRSEAELQEYMDRYIQARYAASQSDAVEEAAWWPSVHTATRTGGEPENPFLDVDYSRPIVNPFEAEGK